MLLMLLDVFFKTMLKWFTAKRTEKINMNRLKKRIPGKHMHNLSLAFFPSFQISYGEIEVKLNLAVSN